MKLFLAIMESTCFFFFQDKDGKPVLPKPEEKPKVRKLTIM